MSLNLDRAFVEDFDASVTLLSQQKGSKLATRVSNTSFKGKSKFVEQLGLTETVRRTSRHQDSPLVNSNHLRRRLDLFTEEWGDLIDDADQVRTLIDPTNAYTMSMGNAFGRAKDRAIIAAATGIAIGTDGLTQISLNNAIGIKTTFTTQTLIDCLELFSLAEVDEDEKKVVCIGARQVSQLLADTQFNDSDHNTLKPLATGKAVTWMGFDIINTQLLNLSGTTRTCFAYVPSGIMLGTGRNMVTRIVERPDKSFSTYVFGAHDIGATRLEESKVVEIPMTEVA